MTRPAAADLLTRHRDLLDERPDVDVDDDDDVIASTPLSARGWSPFLLALDDKELEALEAHGVDARWTSAPPSLLSFVEDVRAAVALPTLTDGGPELVARRHERPSKQRQIDAFARLVAPHAARAARVVDVGSGHGHLTRALAEAMGLPVVGLERDPAIASRAQELSSNPAVSFAITDVVREGLAVRGADCVVGLHACGELGDLVARGLAASTGPAAMVFVGCCLQKQRAPTRRPLCDDDDDVTLPKALLGLSNLTPRDDGVEASRIDNLAARTRRIALRLLLAASGIVVRSRAELEGLNRRAAHDPLPVLVARVYERRGLSLPSAAQIDDAGRRAEVLHASFRRLALPRTLLARVIEVFVLLDRARYLEQHGFDVAAGVLFPADVSPRNLALVAARTGSDV
ncbi:MAG: methyltransferase [Deltaproteobacteria bacterium]|nr:methyltransferase [Deltaproteobacteria bacterium]